MSSLFNATEKAELDALINDVSDTFARPLVLIKSAEQVVVSDNPNHSFVFSQAPTNSVTEVTPITGYFSGRIWYEQRQPTDFLKAFGVGQSRGGDQLPNHLNNGMARLKLEPSGAAFMADTKRVQFDGFTFTIESTPRPHGLFTPKFYTYWLKQTN